MKDNKQKGNLAELAFMHKAASLGFTVSKVMGDYSRYDVLVEKGGRVSRVQVKYVGTAWHACYRVQLTASRRRYTWAETDFIAVYVAREALWYIFPPRAVAGLIGVVVPGTASRKFLSHRLAKYREAWHLLEPLLPGRPRPRGRAAQPGRPGRPPRRAKMAQPR